MPIVDRDMSPLVGPDVPGWWRHVLIALATLILCSCTTVATTNRQQEFWADALAPIETETDVVVTDAEPAATFTGRENAAVAQSIISDNPPQLFSAHGAPLADESAMMIAEGDAELAFPTSCANDQPCSTDGDCATCDGTLVGPGDEYLCDGGDFGSPVGVRTDWTIDGLDQEDAVAHYDTVDGRVIVQPSNRVCIYAPRFAAVRRVQSLHAHERQQFIDEVVEDEAVVRVDEKTPAATSLQRHAVAINRTDRPPSLYRARQQAGGVENLQGTIEVFQSLAPYANKQIVRTGQVDGSQQAELDRCVQAAVTWTGDKAAQVLFDARQAEALIGLQQVGVVYQGQEPHNPRLHLVKLASRGHALPGETVEFTLRFDNIGDQVIGNVTVVDNLATRLEYIPDSAQSSKDANFSATPNETGSSVLRWEIIEPVEPGDGGILQFTARVR